jgi:hypothetical protein
MNLDRSLSQVMRIGLRRRSFRSVWIRAVVHIDFQLYFFAFSTGEMESRQPRLRRRVLAQRLYLTVSGSERTREIRGPEH